MSSRILWHVPVLVASLALPGAALAGGDAPARGPSVDDVVQLAQGKSDDAKGKAKDKDKAKAKAKGKATEKAEKKTEKAAEKAAKKADKAAEKDAKKDEKAAEKDEKQAEKAADAPAADAADRRKREMEKHERRLAQIERIQSLGQKGNNDKLKEKAAQLKGLEDKRHARALARLDAAPAPDEKQAAAGDKKEGTDEKAAPDAPAKKGDGE